MTRVIAIKMGLKTIIFLACLCPCIWIIWSLVNDDFRTYNTLGANPIEAINRYLGNWAIRFLLIVLAITPIRKITGWVKIMQFRRMIGLFAFFYVFLHLSSYVVLDQFFNWQEIWLDITRRNYITVGMVSFVLLLVLAATSTNRMVKKLGGKCWSQLHKLVYPAGILACLHFYMMRKGFQLEPIIYSAICITLLIYRILLAWQKSSMSLVPVRPSSSINNQRNIKLGRARHNRSH